MQLSASTVRFSFPCDCRSYCAASLPLEGILQMWRWSCLGRWRSVYELREELEVLRLKCGVLWLFNKQWWLSIATSYVLDHSKVSFRREIWWHCSRESPRRCGAWWPFTCLRDAVVADTLTIQFSDRRNWSSVSHYFFERKTYRLTEDHVLWFAFKRRHAGWHKLHIEVL